MPTPSYCQTMARYNAWQNQEVSHSIKDLPAAALVQDQGAFFGSILRTLSHLTWGDQTWISRFDGGEAPVASMQDSTEMVPDLATWLEIRPALDARILAWAKTVAPEALQGEFKWYSAAMQRDFARPMIQCVIQLFNHQTHHRGQVHAMVTAVGGKGWVSDLPFMPETQNPL